MATPSPPTRFVALDIHRKYLVVGAVDPHQQSVLAPRRFGFEAFSAWATTHLGPSDAVVLEATSTAWLLYDELEPLVGSVTVAHPLAVKLIAATRVKTDSRDTIKLAHEAFCQFGAGRLGSTGACTRAASACEPSQASGHPAHTSSQPFTCGLAPSQPHAAAGPAVCCSSAAVVALLGPLVLRETARATRSLPVAFPGGPRRSRGGRTGTTLDL
jgi:hypothetical protein